MNYQNFELFVYLYCIQVLGVSLHASSERHKHFSTTQREYLLPFFFCQKFLRILLFFIEFLIHLLQIIQKCVYGWEYSNKQHKELFYFVLNQKDINMYVPLHSKIYIYQFYLLNSFRICSFLIEFFLATVFEVFQIFSRFHPLPLTRLW